MVNYMISLDLDARIAQINAPIHPNRVQPNNKVRKKMAQKWRFPEARNTGRK